MKTTLLLVLSMLSCAAFADNAAHCERYGFTTGTPDFANCMMQLDLAIARAEQASQQQAAQLDMQRRAAMMQMYRPIPIAPPMQAYQIPTNQPRQQTNCRWIANVWNCQ